MPLVIKVTIAGLFVWRLQKRSRGRAGFCSRSSELLPSAPRCPARPRTHGTATGTGRGVSPRLSLSPQEPSRDPGTLPVLLPGVAGPWAWRPHRSLLGVGSAWGTLRPVPFPCRALRGLIRALSVPLQAATPCAPAVNYELVSAPLPRVEPSPDPQSWGFLGRGLAQALRRTGGWDVTGSGSGVPWSRGPPLPAWSRFLARPEMALADVPLAAGAQGRTLASPAIVTPLLLSLPGPFMSRRMCTELDGGWGTSGVT